MKIAEAVVIAEVIVKRGKEGKDKLELRNGEGSGALKVVPTKQRVGVKGKF